MKNLIAALGASLLAAAPASAERLPEGVAPSHYAITWTPDLAAATFRGEETIEVQIEKPTQTIALNAVEIAFTQASIVQRGASQPAQVATDEKREIATLRFAKPIQPGAATLRIQWTGKLNDQLRGLYLTRTARRRYAATQFEATDARRAFPSFDEPAYKATFDVAAVIDRGDIAISNGPQTADTPGPGAGKHTVRFATTPKLSAYLVALLVGDFQCESGSADGIPIRVCGTPEHKGQGAFALEAAEFTMHFYNQYFGIRYPYPKLDFVGVPDFSAGAMENAGCITSRELYLFTDPKQGSLLARQHTAQGAVAHEMAHQWFGDLVTMKWWDDLWLNEGFATWMSFKPMEAWKPEWGFAAEEATSATEAMEIDSLESTRPIRQRAETPAEILELSDRITYDKASAVLRMVESYVGEEPFRKGVNHYLAQHAGGNATAADFWGAIAEASGKPVDKIMPAFVDQPGVPMVSAEASCGGGKTRLQLAARRYRFDRAKLERSSGERWPIPVCAGPGPACALLDGRGTLELSGCEPVYPNAGAHGYYRSVLPASQMLRLARAGKLTAGERIALAEDAWAALRVDRIKAGDYLALAEVLRDDPSGAVWRLLAERLTELSDQLVAEADRPAFEAWVRRTFEPTRARLGFARRASDGDDAMTVRASLLTLLGREGADRATIEVAQQVVDHALSDQPYEPTMLQAALQVAAAKSDSSALYDRLLAGSKRTKSSELEVAFLRSLGTFRPPALVDRTLRYSLGPEVRSQDAPFVITRILGARSGRRAAWDFVRAHWREIDAKLSNYETPALVEALAGFCDPAARAEVRDFFAQNPLPTAERTLRQTLESIDGCIDVRARQQAPLSAWLAARAAAKK